MLIFFSFIRYINWLKNPNNGEICADGYFSMLHIREYKKNKHSYISVVPQTIVPFPNIYPPLGIYLISFLNIKIINKYFGLMNSLFDFIYFIVLIAVMLWLDIDYSEMLVVGITFIFLPTIFGLNPIHKMHFNLTWRDLGRLFSTLYFLTISTSLQVISSPYLLALYSIAILFFILIFYSSQFALQCAFFGTITLSILTLNPFIISIPVIATFLTILFDKKRVFRFYKYKIGHIKSYYISLRNSHDQATGDFAFTITHLYDAINALFTGKLKKFRKISSCDPFLRGIILFPVQVPVIVGLVYINDPISLILAKWYFAAVVLWFLTLTPILKIFGEADRYLEYIGYFPILVGIGYILSYGGIQLNLIKYFIYITCIIQILYTLRFILPVFINRRRENRVNISDKVIDLIKDKNVFPIPFYLAWKTAYIGNCNVLYPPMLTSTTETTFMSNYPLPNWSNFIEINKKYKIEYILCESSEILNSKNKLLESISDKIITDKNFTLFKIKN